MRQLVQELGDVYGLECYLTFPDGRQYQYSRIIDEEFWNTADQRAKEFFGDDMIAAFTRITNADVRGNTEEQEREAVE